VGVLSSAVASLMARGVRVALDDFGGGGASLAQLRRLPLDSLLLDATLLAGVPNGKKESALASGVVALGHALGLEVIAKGVQTPEQVEFLSQFGCQQIEGDHAGRAMNDREFAELLRRERSVGTVRALR
jgi:EAL domain-containing protein (putative c-di-GMP-specific phosphodiesterase class I)